MKKVSIESAGDLHVETMTAETLALEALADVMIFMGKLRNRESRKLPPVRDLAEALQWCYNVISKSRVVLRLDYNEAAEGTTVNQELARFSKLIERLQENVSAPPADDATAAAMIDRELDVERWITLLAGLKKKAEASVPLKVPDKEDALRKLSAGLETIPELRRKIESISTLLHTGGDAVAMDQLTALSTTLVSIIQGLQSADPFLPEGLPGVRLKQGTCISDELAKLTTVFRQIVDAFDGKDIVLLCDLLEYELLPGLLVLEEILNLLVDKVKTNFS